jgi:hypothetical protein
MEDRRAYDNTVVGGRSVVEQLRNGLSNEELVDFVDHPIHHLVGGIRWQIETEGCQASQTRHHHVLCHIIKERDGNIHYLKMSLGIFFKVINSVRRSGLDIWTFGCVA